MEREVAILITVIGPPGSGKTRALNIIQTALSEEFNFNVTSPIIRFSNIEQRTYKAELKQQ